MEYKFKDSVEKLLEERRRTKKSLFDHLKMTGQGFDAMLKNNTVSAVKLAQIAEFLDVPVSYFYGGNVGLPKKNMGSVTFGEQVVEKMAEDLGSLRHFLEEEIREKNLEIREKNVQIAGLQKNLDSAQRMLEVVLGKSKGATRKPLSKDEQIYADTKEDYTDAVLREIVHLLPQLNSPLAKLVAPR